MKKTLLLVFTLVLALSLLSASLTIAEENKVVMVIQNIYVDLGGTGTNAVYFVEETDPENEFYADWDDWFINASYVSGSLRQGTQVSMGFVEGAFVTKIINDGVADVVFLVDGEPYEVALSVGAKLAAIKTADGEYCLLTKQ